MSKTSHLVFIDLASATRAEGPLYKEGPTSLGELLTAKNLTRYATNLRAEIELTPRIALQQWLHIEEMENDKTLFLHTTLHFSEPGVYAFHIPNLPQLTDFSLNGESRFFGHMQDKAEGEKFSFATQNKQTPNYLLVHIGQEDIGDARILLSFHK